MALISDRTKEQLMAAKQNEAKIIFTAETKEFSDAIKKSSRDIEALKSELRLNAAEMKNNGTSIAGLTKRQSLLHQELEAQKSKTRNLNEELQKAKSIYGSNSVEVNKLTKQLNTSKVAEQNIEREIKTTNTALEQQKKQSEAVATAQKGLKKGLDAVGKASGVVAAGVGAVVAGTIKMASDYENSLAKVETLADGAMTNFNGKSMSMKDAITELSNETGKSVDDIAESVYQAISAGQDASNAVAFVSDNLKLSKGGFTEVAKATDIVTTILNAYNMKSEESTRVSDILIQTQNKGKTTVDALAESMGNVIPIAKAQNVNLENVAASYAIMTANGVNTARTTTNLNSLLNELGDSSKTAAIALKEETGKSFQELMSDGHSLGDVLKSLQNYAKKNDVQFGELFKKSNARSGALVLMKNGADGFNKSLKVMKSSSGSTASAVEKLQTSSVRFNKSLNKVKNIGLEVGGVFLEELNPHLDEFEKKSEEVVEYASEHMDEIIDGIKTVGVVAGTAFAVNKVVKFGNSLVDVGKGVYTVVGAVQKMAVARAIDTTATEAETVAQVGLNTAMKANIFIGVAAAVGTLAYALYQATTRTKEQSEEVKKAIEVRKEFKNSVEDATVEVDKEYQTYDRYMYQLDKYIDKNGKIKKGYKDRVEVIRKDLKDSFGIEMNIINGTVQGWQKVRKSIQDVIATEKAKAYMASQKDNYNEALSGQAEYSKKLAENSKKMRDTVQELSDARLELKALENDATSSMKDRTDAAAKIQKLEDNLTEYQQRHKEYSKTYAEYSNSVKNYESLTTAVEKGNTDRINRALARVTYSLKMAENANKETLNQQVKDTKQMYEYLQEAHKKGTDGITSYQVSQAKKAWQIAERELKKASGKYAETGKEGGKKYSNGFKVGVEEFFTLNPVDVSVNMAVKNKGVNKKATSIAGIPSIMKIQHNAEGGIYAKGAFVTSFAEESAEAAIPLNNKPRSIALYKQAGEIMGLNRDKGNISIKNQIEVSETNSLLRAILKKDNNLYINADRLNERTESSRNRTDGIKYALQGRGLAIE